MPNGTGATEGFERLRFAARLKSRRIAVSFAGGSSSSRPWFAIASNRQHQRELSHELKINMTGGVNPLVRAEGERRGTDLQAVTSYRLASAQAASPFCKSAVRIKTQSVEHGCVVGRGNPQGAEINRWQWAAAYPAKRSAQAGSLLRLLSCRLWRPLTIGRVCRQKAVSELLERLQYIRNCFNLFSPREHRGNVV